MSADELLETKDTRSVKLCAITSSREQLLAGFGSEFEERRDRAGRGSDRKETGACLDNSGLIAAAKLAGNWAYLHRTRFFSMLLICKDGASLSVAMYVFMCSYT